MTNERDDEILGRALSRAIETLDAEETPYDSSRMAARSIKRGTSFWRVAALAASIVLAGALGSTLLERPATDEPVGGQPTGSPNPAATRTPTATVNASPIAPRDPNAIDHQRLFFYRGDGLPPTSQHWDATGPQMTAEDRVRARLDGLNNARSGVSPTNGAGNAFPLADPNTLKVSSVKIFGGTATVDFTLPPGGWPTRGAAMTLALQQQLVYTATEEPGVDRLVVTENGGKPTTIDQLVWDKPLTRDDVSGYRDVKNEAVTEDQSRAACAPNCPSPVPARLSNNWSVDTFALGVARFVVQVDSGDWQEFTAAAHAAVDVKNPWSSKYVVTLEVGGTEAKPGVEIVDRSPLRSIRSVTGGGKTIYELALDDGRPWRVVLLHNPDRIIIDVGGFARSISDTVVVYQPAPMAAQSGAILGSQPSIGRQFTVSGLGRTFEATVQWRVVDSARRIVASGFTTASRGTSAVWGTYQISVQLPATASGNVTLEVYWGSPRDGSEVGLVQVPLIVR